MASDGWGQVDRVRLRIVVFGPGLCAGVEAARVGCAGAQGAGVVRIWSCGSGFRGG